MAEFTGRIMNGHYLSFSPTGKPLVILELNERENALQMVDELKAKEKLTVKIDEFKEKRSRNANNYAWKLITEIGNATRQSKDDVYLVMLKRYGQSEMISVRAGIPVGRFLKYYEEAGESTLHGKLFKHYRVYTGSSEFDTKEMSIFIDGVVSEAKELNIPTETPEQIAKMKSLWGE